MAHEDWTMVSLPGLTRTGIHRTEDIEPSPFASDDPTVQRHMMDADDGRAGETFSDGTMTDLVGVFAPDTEQVTRIPDVTAPGYAGEDSTDLIRAANAYARRVSRPSREKAARGRPEEVTTSDRITPIDTGIIDVGNAMSPESTIVGDLQHIAYRPTTPVPVDEDIVAGRYRLEEPIGEGGMGSVFRATHLRLGKSFALKRMHGSLSGDAVLRDLFYREARLASSLSHPNIVSVVDFGEDRHLGAFMVMELVSGAPPNIGGAGLPLRRALDVLMQVAEALHYSHSKGVIHCDIKPDNILVSQNAASGKRVTTAKLVDFGLAHLQRATQHGRGTVHGTPQYLAPERFLGQPPHPSMDIYSLGVVAYEMICGQLPFSAKHAPHSQLHQTPKPLSQRCKNGCDERVEQLVMKMIEKEPHDRHQDMGQVIFELRTVMNMLGFTKGRARRRTQHQPDNNNPSERTRQALRAFELSPLPTALLSGEGLILSANRAMVEFLGRGRRVEGESFSNPMLLNIYPQFGADLRYVNIIQQAYTRALVVSNGAGQNMELFVHLSPGAPHTREVLVTVMPPPQPTEQ